MQVGAFNATRVLKRLTSTATVPPGLDEAGFGLGIPQARRLRQAGDI